MKGRDWNYRNRDLTTISGRLNAVLDLSGNYPYRGRERYEAVGLDLEKSPTGTKRYLIQNTLPPKPALRKLVTKALSHLDQEYDTSLVLAWIEYGSSIPCPFEITKSFVSGDESWGVYDSSRFALYLDRLKMPRAGRELIMNTATGIDPVDFLDMCKSNRQREHSEILYLVVGAMSYQLSTVKENIPNMEQSYDLALAYTDWIFHKGIDPSTSAPISNEDKKAAETLLGFIASNYGYDEFHPRNLAPNARIDLCNKIKGKIDESTTGMSLHSVAEGLNNGNQLPELLVRLIINILVHYKLPDSVSD